MRVDFPKKLRGLLDPHDYKVIFGGRDGVKSWSVAQALLALGARNKAPVPLRSRDSEVDR